jgi:hypothetical protein
MDFDYNRIDEILKDDPLGELARKERTMLLLISVVAIGISKAGLVPTKIVGFGVEFSNIDRSAILWLLVATVLYFMVTFLAHALPDFLSWQVRYNRFWAELANERSRLEEKYGPGYEEMSSESQGPSQLWERYSKSRARFKTVTLLKISLDLAVPVLVGFGAIVIAAMAAWCQAGVK